MTAKIIQLPLSGGRPVHSRKPWRLELFPETGRQRAGRSRNPLRQHLRRIERALVIAGKLHRNEPLREWDDIGWLGEGVDAARLLAEQLALVAERMHTP